MKTIASLTGRLAQLGAAVTLTGTLLGAGLAGPAAANLPTPGEPIMLAPQPKPLKTQAGKDAAGFARASWSFSPPPMRPARSSS